MNHFASPRFWRAYEELPAEVRKLADRCFERLKRDPEHPSLHFKIIGRFRSVRIGRRYRALGVIDAERVIRFWIGTHGDYDKLLRR